MKTYYVLYLMPGEFVPYLELVRVRNRTSAENYIKAIRGRNVTVLLVAEAEKYTPYAPK